MSSTSRIGTEVPAFLGARSVHVLGIVIFVAMIACRTERTEGEAVTVGEGGDVAPASLACADTSARIRQDGIGLMRVGTPFLQLRSTCPGGRDTILHTSRRAAYVVGAYGGELILEADEDDPDLLGMITLRGGSIKTTDGVGIASSVAELVAVYGPGGSQLCRATNEVGAVTFASRPSMYFALRDCVTYREDALDSATLELRVSAISVFTVHH